MFSGLFERNDSFTELYEDYETDTGFVLDFFGGFALLPVEKYKSFNTSMASMDSPSNSESWRVWLSAPDTFGKWLDLQEVFADFLQKSRNDVISNEKIHHIWLIHMMYTYLTRQASILCHIIARNHHSTTISEASRRSMGVLKVQGIQCISKPPSHLTTRLFKQTSFTWNPQQNLNPFLTVLLLDLHLFLLCLIIR